MEATMQAAERAKDVNPTACRIQTAREIITFPRGFQASTSRFMVQCVATYPRRARTLYVGFSHLDADRVPAAVLLAGRME